MEAGFAFETIPPEGMRDFPKAFDSALIFLRFFIN